MGIFISRDDVRQELEQVRTEFETRIEQMESTLLAEIRQYQSIEQSVKEAIDQHSHTVPAVPQINQLRNRVDYFSDKMHEVTQSMDSLTEQVKQLTWTVGGLSPNPTNGEPKPIHDVIVAYTKRILAEIDNMSLAHSNWLEEHTRKLEEAGKTAAALQGLIGQSRLHIAPKPESELRDDAELTA